jgi:hypothetical protein
MNDQIKVDTMPITAALATLRDRVSAGYCGITAAISLLESERIVHFTSVEPSAALLNFLADTR